VRLAAIEAALLRKRLDNAEKLIRSFPKEQIDTKGRLGHTALYLVANRGYKNLVEILLERGADRTIKDTLGATPADAAYRYPEVVELINTFKSPEGEEGETLGMQPLEVALPSTPPTREETEKRLLREPRQESRWMSRLGLGGWFGSK
jgi:ankyrin repeat protein